MAAKRPVILCVLDGWGWREEIEDNAAAQADTPAWDRLWQTAPRAFLKTSGRAVGLPEGQMGNSEVGHMTLGAGRVVLQDLPRIDRAIEDGSLAQKPELTQFIEALKHSGGTAHLLGLVSPGGVHSHQRHIAALARAIAAAGVPVAVHVLTDGRDTPPRSAHGFVQELDADLPDQARIVTVGGRYFGMDRDKRWDRVEKAYRAIVDAEGERAGTAGEAIDQAYARGESDEFIAPTVLTGYAGMAPGDGLIMANFRTDRARQILTALLDPAFDGFDRGDAPKLVASLGMVPYSDALDRFLPALFPPEDIQDTFGQVLARAGKTQLRLAETEKYPHVTFFFDGGAEAEAPGEERILIPSPKVATYDLQPEMSAPQVTEALVEAIDGGRFDAIIVNYANPDMVGHSGDIDAAKQAVEAVDQGLQALLAAVERANGVALITADHGNVEMMRDPDTGDPHTAHTKLDVPVFLFNAPAETAVADGTLADVAPTLLDLMGLEIPAAMTGTSLIRKAKGAAA
ncbi:MAG: 2,3-bisphosphoglycerate-independent phosphoglycerate mutase [Rhodothalassiaceae bacterium]